MNTERTSLRAAASPACSGDDLDRHPERPERVGEAPGAGPDASAGVRRPRAGTGPSSATSANDASPTSAASSRFKRRRRRVQIREDGSRPQRGPCSLGGRARDRRAVDAQDDVAACDRRSVVGHARDAGRLGGAPGS